MYIIEIYITDIFGTLMYLERLINLPEITTVAGLPVSVAETHSASEVSRSACHRVMPTLLDEGLPEESEGDGTYVIGEASSAPHSPENPALTPGGGGATSQSLSLSLNVQ